MAIDLVSFTADDKPFARGFANLATETRGETLRGGKAEANHEVGCEGRLLHPPGVGVGAGVVDLRLEEFVRCLVAVRVPRTRTAAELHHPEL